MIVNIQRQPGANIIARGRPHQGAAAAAAGVAAVLRQGQHPDRPDHHHPRFGRTTCEFELMLTVALVVMVIFLFLRNFAATIIPSVAVPLSLDRARSA